MHHSDIFWYIYISYLAYVYSEKISQVDVLDNLIHGYRSRFDGNYSVTRPRINNLIVPVDDLIVSVNEDAITNYILVIGTLLLRYVQRA